MSRLREKNKKKTKQNKTKQKNKKKGAKRWIGVIQARSGLRRGEESGSATVKVASLTDSVGLSEEGKKRVRVCDELIKTEVAYLEQLTQLVSCYEEPLTKAGVLEEMDRKQVFINVRVLVQIHQELNESLRAKLEGADIPGPNFAVGAALLSITPLLQFYKEFVNKYHEASSRLRELNERKKFALVLDKCKHGSQAGGLNSLENLLIGGLRVFQFFFLRFHTSL